jgi:hypothetical protein
LRAPNLRHSAFLVADSGKCAFPISFDHKDEEAHPGYYERPRPF